jgi:hypothetical protein
MKEEVLMTKINSNMPAQHSVFSSVIVNVLTGAMIVAAGILTFAQFANV